MKKYIALLFIFCVNTQRMNVGFTEIDSSRHITFMESPKAGSEITSEVVIAILHQHYSIFPLLCSITSSLSNEKSRSFTIDKPAERLEHYAEVVVLGDEKQVRRGGNVSEKEKTALKRSVTDLAIATAEVPEDGASFGHAVGNIADIVESEEIQDAVGVVASFAASMAKADHAKHDNESTPLYVIRMFITVFEEAQKAGVLEAIPELLQGGIALASNVVDAGEAAVRKVRSTGCCIIL